MRIELMKDAKRTSTRVNGLHPTAVNRILADVRETQQGGVQTVSLMRGEPDFPTPAFIVEAATEALAGGRTTYPNNQGELALRTAIAERLERRMGLRYDPDDQILVTTGATLGLSTALATLLNPGDEVVLPQPIYDAYLPVIDHLGGFTQSVEAKITRGRFTIEPEDLAAACTERTRVLLLNTPWNPTGSVLTRDELAVVMEVAAQRDLVVVSDEIYEEILYDDRVHVSPATLSNDAASRTIIVNSFSKTYAMTGWRLGYCAGPAALIRAMGLALQQSSRGPATFVQDAGAAALQGPQDCITTMLAEYTARRDLVRRRLGDIPGVDLLVPEGGFFAMVDLRQWGQSSDKIRKRLLKEFGVVVAHGAAYGAAAEGMLRVSFASGGENLETGLQRLHSGLLELQR